MSYSYGTPSYLHSYPTRRSSDLHAAGEGGLDLAARDPGNRAAQDLRRIGRRVQHQRQQGAEPGLTEEGPQPDALQRRAELRSEEHTSELQSRENLVCRLLLEKKN